MKSIICGPGTRTVCVSSRPGFIPLTKSPEKRTCHVRYADENGRLHEESFDLIVLSVGLQVPESSKETGPKARGGSGWIRVCQDADLCAY